jgi:3-deoxy-D-manno-octulosonic-acid transferase
MVFRLIIGKEDSLRISERFGIISLNKSKKKTIWIHAASVGEAKLALTLAEQLQKKFKDNRVLITTGTKTSASIVRSNTSPTLIHQYIPIDNIISVYLFLDYWKPQIGIFIEGELWPNMLYLGEKYCPLILINARMSDKSFERWEYFRPLLSMLASKFKQILCQSSLDTIKYHKLGIKSAKEIGNLKYSSTKLEVDSTQLKSLTSQIVDRKVFLAVSTHPGDELKILDVHSKLRENHENLLTIIAPRHTNRSKEIQALIKAKKISYKTRSKKEKITDSTEVYIADTMGELGLFFSIAKASFIGGSFANGGHNPIEPAFFNTYILFGPDMSNFFEIAEEFTSQNAAIQVSDTKTLVEALEKIFEGKMDSSNLQKKKIIKNHSSVLDAYVSYVKDCMENNKNVIQISEINSI